jgi:hypothetical protein
LPLLQLECRCCSCCSLSAAVAVVAVGVPLSQLECRCCRCCTRYCSCCFRPHGAAPTSCWAFLPRLGQARYGSPGVRGAVAQHSRAGAPSLWRHSAQGGQQRPVLDSSRAAAVGRRAAAAGRADATLGTPRPGTAPRVGCGQACRRRAGPHCLPGPQPRATAAAATPDGEGCGAGVLGRPGNARGAARGGPAWPSARRGASAAVSGDGSATLRPALCRAQNAAEPGQAGPGRP